MKKQINILCDNYNVNDLEKHIFKNYLKSKKIDFSKSKILGDYYSNFKIDDKLDTEINKLKIDSFIELEKSQELLIPKNDRKVNGAFFTPRNIVDKIIEEVRPKRNDLCTDISCGCGSFIIGLLKYFNKKYKKSINETLSQNIYGFDILDYNIRRTKILISIFIQVS